MAMFVSALVLSLSLLVLAGFYHVYQSPQRFPAFAGGRYSEFTAVLSTCLMGQGIAMSVANIGEAASWTYAVAAGMVLAAAFAALRIARLSRPATALAWPSSLMTSDCDMPTSSLCQLLATRGFVQPARTSNATTRIVRFAATENRAAR